MFRVRTLQIRESMSQEGADVFVCCMLDEVNAAPTAVQLFHCA